MFMPFKYLIHPLFEFLNWKYDDLIIIHAGLEIIYVFHKFISFPASYPHETHVLLPRETQFRIPLPWRLICSVELLVSEEKSILILNSGGKIVLLLLYL